MPDNEACLLTAGPRMPWNKGKLIGAKLPLRELQDGANRYWHREKCDQKANSESRHQQTLDNQRANGRALTFARPCQPYHGSYPGAKWDVGIGRDGSTATD
jgi:hypothetical protein